MTEQELTPEAFIEWLDTKEPFAPVGSKWTCPLRTWLQELYPSVPNDHLYCDLTNMGPARASYEPDWNPRDLPRTPAWAHNFMIEVDMHHNWETLTAYGAKAVLTHILKEGHE